MSVLWKVIDQELVINLRPLDRQTEFFCKLRGRPAMIEVTVRYQDFFKPDTLRF